MRGTVITGSAGAGKTRRMIESVSHLLEEAKIGNTLILASSAQAVDDIKARLHDFCSTSNGLEVSALPVAIHTVASLCKAIVEGSEPNLQFISNFRAWFILKKCLQNDLVSLQSSYSRVRDKTSFTSEILELFEAASINTISIEDLPCTEQNSSKVEDIKSIYKYFNDFCQQHDLIPEFSAIPKALPILNTYGKHFNHIFIDHYEYLCPGERQAVETLAGDHTNLTIFVDTIQSDLDFRKIPIQKLEKPYRQLTTEIVGQINRLMGREVYPANDSELDAQSFAIVVRETGIDESEYIARLIRDEVKRNGRKYSDFAILCRETENLGKTVSDALKKYSIPFSGGTSISHDPLVRFILLSLQIIGAPHEDDAVLKWLSTPVAGLSRTDVYRSYTNARAKKQDFLKVVTAEAHLSVDDSEGTSTLSFRKSKDRLQIVLSVLDLIKNELKSGKNVWEIVVPIITQIDAMLPDGEVPQAIAFLMDTIRDIEATYEKRPRLGKILKDIKIGLMYISNSTKYISADDDTVKIMSIQESRGLEFPYVFIPGMVSDFFPARHPARQLLYGEELDDVRALLSEIDLPGTVEPARWRKQERNLLYTAITRAKEKLYLTFARQYPDRNDCEPSPFLTAFLNGKELSAENCLEYGIDYQDCADSDNTNELPSLDDISSETDLATTCCQYIMELKQLAYQKAEQFTKLLTNAGMGDLLPPKITSETAIPQVASSGFSHTAIRNYLSCPRRYFLSYMLRVTSEDKAGAHFGRLVHDVLSKFHKDYPSLAGMEFRDLWAVMYEILSNMWNERMESGFAGNQLQARSYMRLAEEILKAYLQGECERWEAERSCIRTEENFSFPFFDKHKLRGRIDRIDFKEQVGNEIVDFKTSAYDTAAESSMKSKFLNMDDDPDYRPQDFQLPIYYLGGLSEKLEPQKLVIYQLRNLSKSTRTPFRRELEIKPDEDERSGKKDKFITKGDIESVEKDILEALEGMASGRYPAEPRDDNVCERECDFSFLCDREMDEEQ